MRCDTPSRHYAFLKPYRAPHIIVYLLRFNLKIAPKLVAISAVKEEHVANPEDSGTDNQEEEKTHRRDSMGHATQFAVQLGAILIKTDAYLHEITQDLSLVIDVLGRGNRQRVSSSEFAEGIISVLPTPGMIRHDFFRNKICTEPMVRLHLTTRLLGLSEIRERARPHQATPNSQRTICRIR
jgi:hypothetical protein